MLRKIAELRRREHDSWPSLENPTQMTGRSFESTKKWRGSVQRSRSKPDKDFIGKPRKKATQDGRSDILVRG